MFTITCENLKELVADRCRISRVNFDFVYGRVLQQNPKTFDEFEEIIEAVLFNAYWGGEIKELFKGMLSISRSHTQAKRMVL